MKNLKLNEKTRKKKIKGGENNSRQKKSKERRKSERQKEEEILQQKHKKNDFQRKDLHDKVWITSNVPLLTKFLTRLET